MKQSHKMSTQMDILTNLYNLNLLHVIDKIISYMIVSPKSVARSFQVSRSWHHILSDAQIWSGFPSRCTVSNPLFKAVRASTRSPDKRGPKFDSDLDHLSSFIRTLDKPSRMFNQWFNSERIESELGNPHESSVTSLHYMPQFRTLAVGYTDSTVHCYDENTMRETSSFLVFDKRKLPSNGFLSARNVLPVLHVLDDGTRLVAVVGSHIRFIDVANIADDSSVAFPLYANSVLPITHVKIRDGRLYSIDFRYNFGIFSVAALIDAEISAKEPLYWQKINELKDIEVDDERFYLLLDVNGGTSVYVYCAESLTKLCAVDTMKRLCAYSMRLREGVGSMLSLGRLLLCAGPRRINVFDNERRRLVGVVVYRLGYEFQLKSADSFVMVLDQRKKAMLLDACKLQQLVADVKEPGFLKINLEDVLVSSMDLACEAQSCFQVSLHDDTVFFTQLDNMPAISRWKGVCD